MPKAVIDLLMLTNVANFAASAFLVLAGPDKDWLWNVGIGLISWGLIYLLWTVRRTTK